ncbi:unnamed protein product [Rotaria magnacalcarata]|uniref:VWFA domain-containing protein n=1 Tax=Rotaria magnacalcarata TaxID=392030 RepID=A0A816KQ06_9BILA|nr:unnamed protein product [Rotaria magnacalcarata]
MFLRQLQCGSELYSGEGPICQYNATHQGTCSAGSIKDLEDSSTYCSCTGSENTCSQDLKMDLGIVLDASGSVGQSNYQLQLNFTKDVIQRVNVGSNTTHVGIINYSTDIQTLTRLNKDYSLVDKLRLVNQAVYYGGGTKTSLALQQIDEIFSYKSGRRKSEGVTPVIFAITDGASDKENLTIKAANVLKQKGINFGSVGVGDEPRLGELHAICSPPIYENYFAISNYTALEQKLNQFTSKSCSESTSVSSNATDSADFIDYETTRDLPLSRWMQFKSYFHRSSTKPLTTKRNHEELIVDKPDKNSEFVYVGVKSY